MLLLISCDRETSRSESQILNCRVTDLQGYGWLAEADFTNIPIDEEARTFSIDIETGYLATGLEGVCCDRAVKMSVVAKGTRGTDFWAVYERTFDGFVRTVSTSTLVIQRDKNVAGISFVMSGGNVLEAGTCVQK